MMPADDSVADAAAATVLPFVLGTPRKGMVTPGIVFSNGGNPASVLIITTAAAPCACPICARATRAQTPRKGTTTLPATPAYSDSLPPREIELSGFRRTMMGSEPPGRGALFALMARTVGPVLSAILVKGSMAVESM